MLTFLIPFHGNIPESGKYAGDQYKTHYDRFGAFISITALDWLDDHGGAIAGVAAVAVAWFTLTLKWSTDRLWDEAKLQRGEAKRQSALIDAQTRISEGQQALARAQHFVQHRPRLKIRHVSFGRIDYEPSKHVDFGEQLVGGLVVVNVGGSKAILTSSRYCLYASDKTLPIRSPLDGKSDMLLAPKTLLDIGQSIAAGLDIQIQTPPARPGFSFFKIGHDGWLIFAIGEIRYLDEEGRERMIGFCRQWNGTGASRPVDDPDYEYED